MNLHLERAVRLFEAEQYEAAYAQAQKALKLDPEASTAIQIAARSAFEMGRADEAMSLSARLISEAPDDARGDYLMGTLAGRSDDHARAIKHLRRVVDRLPASPFQRLLAAHLVMNGQLEEGLARLQVSRRMSPEEPDLLDVFARVLSEKGRRDLAEELAKSYAEQSPDSAESHFEIAELWMDLGRLDHAKHHLLRSLIHRGDDHTFERLTDCVVQSHWAMRVPEHRFPYVLSLGLAVVAGALGLAFWAGSALLAWLVYVALGFGILGAASVVSFGALWSLRRFFRRRVEQRLRTQLRMPKVRGFSDLIQPSESGPEPPEQWC